jgi:organic hydroperoxide reductase OsmC/OhrA
MPATHRYVARIRWTGDLGTGTKEYRGYARDHVVEVPGKAPILLTSSLGARSDPSRHNPDELVVAALASCHMLWYLHLCSSEGVVVTSYVDDAEGVLETARDGSGHFTSATLRPQVEIDAGSLETAHALHAAAHEKCFVASSVNFPVACEPTIRRRATAGHGP